MSVKILIDMNLSPDWVPVLQRHGWSAVHWSTLGDRRATDRTIMDWAVANGYIVFTHDLDFGTMLALTHVTGPSVLQVRGKMYCLTIWNASWLRHFGNMIPTWQPGALVVVDESRCRVRVLPF